MRYTQCGSTGCSCVSIVEVCVRRSCVVLLMPVSPLSSCLSCLLRPPLAHTPTICSTLQHKPTNHTKPHQQAQLMEWEAAEAHKRQLAREIALKLKEDRAAQLADRDLVSESQLITSV